MVKTRSTRARLGMPSRCNNCGENIMHWHTYAELVFLWSNILVTSIILIIVAIVVIIIIITTTTITLPHTAPGFSPSTKHTPQAVVNQGALHPQPSVQPSGSGRTLAWFREAHARTCTPCGRHVDAFRLCMKHFPTCRCFLGLEADSLDTFRSGCG